ncbi:hypothetical protein [Stutzerimonas stutzeri]|uniref:hypothetical protein n=1 Tax=Stutzerimonas stutzeri TaxID=316 RepID=UPI0013791299|nr:hypothetical protein [Stutzerimonas stutzeri]
MKEAKNDSQRKICIRATPAIIAAIAAERARAEKVGGYAPSATRVAQRAIEKGLGVDHD